MDDQIGRAEYDIDITAEQGATHPGGKASSRQCWPLDRGGHLDQDIHITAAGHVIHARSKNTDDCVRPETFGGEPFEVGELLGVQAHGGNESGPARSLT